MKKFHLSLCLGALTLLFDACSVSQLSNIGSNKELLINESLPKTNNLKSLSDISNIAFEWDPLYDDNIKGFYLYRLDDANPEFKLVGTIKNKF